MQSEIYIQEKTDSCKISINAKGQFSAEIKVYDYDLEDAVTKALAQAKTILEVIKEQNKEERK